MAVRKMTKKLEKTNIAQERTSRRRKTLGAVGGAIALTTAALGVVHSQDGEPKEAHKTEQVVPANDDVPVVKQPKRATTTTVMPTTTEAPATTSPPTTEAPPTTAPPSTETTVSAPERIEARKLTPEMWQSHMDSTVRIIVPSGLGRSCLGNKMNINGETYITTAAHCITDEGSVLDEGSVQTDIYLSSDQPARNITDKITEDFIVADPVTLEPIAKLDKVAIGTNGVDVLVATVKDTTAAYDSKMAQQAGTGSERPRVGDEVAAYSSAYIGQKGGFEMQQRTGEYLGEYDYAFGLRDGRTAFASVDVIGFQETEGGDVHGEGASGLSLLAAGYGALGPQRSSFTDATDQAIRESYFNNLSLNGIDLENKPTVVFTVRVNNWSPFVQAVQQ